MSDDVLASALEGQAIANMISNLRGRLANVKADRQLEEAVIQMKEAYDARIAVLKKNNDLLNQSTNSYRSAAEKYKSAAENNYTKGSEYKRQLEIQQAANAEMKKDLVTALSEGLVYKAVASAARQALAAEPAARQRTLITYKQIVINEIGRGLDTIKEKNGEEVYGFSKQYLKWAASQPYLSDVSAELNRLLQS